MATETIPATGGQDATTAPGAPILSVTIEGVEDNQVKLRGMLQEVNLAERTCRVYTSDSEYVSCRFDNELETDVIYALGQDVEVAGEVTQIRRKGQDFEVKELRLQSISELSKPLPSAEGKRPLTGRDLLESGLVGMWEGRQEDEDDIEFARRLRREASGGGKD